MTARVTVYDETSLGKRGDGLTLEFLTERVTAREVIRARVWQEAAERNARPVSDAGERVAPTPTERLLNGPRPQTPRRLDWQQEYAAALRAFERNRFLLLIDDRQILDLDEQVELRPGSEIVYLKLVPLIGG